MQTVGLTAAAPAAAAAPPTITALATGWAHSCALTSSGGVKCWGSNFVGQLGDGTTTDRSTPVDVVGLTTGVSAIAAGGNHTCALTTAGAVKCWGGNGFGGVGDGTTTDRSTPTDVSGITSGASAIAAGAFHSCAALGSGVRCWGQNDFGQLGDGSQTNRPTPVAVVGITSGTTALSAGGKHTCALGSGGGLKCWGDNQSGQLGDGTGVSPRTIPTDVFGLGSGVSAVAAGGQHSCALLSGGGAKCWGRNHLGQVGDGTSTTRLAPVDVSGLTSGVGFLAAGRWHTCAVVAASGGVKCWGSPQGNGSAGDPKFLTPTDIAGLASGAVSLAAGEGHTCAAMAAGGVKCFGNNGSGQLGNASTTTTMTPVDVSFGGTPVARAVADFDGDGDSDRSVFRKGAWYVAGQPTVFLGAAGDIPVPGDYDGDGTTERAVYRKGAWYVEGQPTVYLGNATDIPVPGDYDGNGTTDRAVYRNGAWYVEGQPTAYLGNATDIPVPGDYDGNGTTERAVYRKGAWYVEGQPTVFLGNATDVPVPGDYDANATTERAVYRKGAWHVQGQPTVFLGNASDIPLPLPQAIYRAYF
jgi:alpha-tubulin suppressor-like RCC1 family protein